MSGCHNNVPMVVDPKYGGISTHFGVPPGTTPVPVAAGATSTVNARLAAAGGILGRVIASDNRAPLDFVKVTAYDASFNLVGWAYTEENGKYRLNRLRP